MNKAIYFLSDTGHTPEAGFDTFLGGRPAMGQPEIRHMPCKCSHIPVNGHLVIVKNHCQTGLG